MRVRLLPLLVVLALSIPSAGLFAETEPAGQPDTTLVQAAPAASDGYVVAEVEYRKVGFILDAALAKIVLIGEGSRYADLAALEYAVADANRRLRNNRVFDLTSSVGYELLETGGGGGAGTAKIVVDARTSITAMALPFPKYNSDDGFSLAVRFKDFNFLGTLEPLTLSFNYYTADGAMDLGAEFALPFDLAGGAWRYEADFTVDWDGDALLLEGSTSLAATYPLPGLGPGWAVKPSVSYAYDRSDAEYEFIAGAGLSYSFEAGIPWTLALSGTYDYYYQGGEDPYLQAALSAGSTFVLLETGFLGKLSYTFSTGPFANASLPDLGYRDAGWSLSQSLKADQVDWVGNFRSGASLSVSQGAAYHLRPALPSDRYDLSLSATAQYFTPFSAVVGLNTRLIGRWYASWTFIGETNDEDWEGDFRGVEGDLYGDLGLVATIELPIDLAQGRFFGLETLAAEVFANPFLDFGFVRTDPEEPVWGTGQGILCGGMEVIVFPDKARAFSYRVSAGYDLLDLLETKDLKLGSLELWLGLGLHF